jgi:hypothetical protein
MPAPSIPAGERGHGCHGRLSSTQSVGLRIPLSTRATQVASALRNAALRSSELPLLNRRSRSTDRLLFGRNTLIVLSGSLASLREALDLLAFLALKVVLMARLPMNRCKVSWSTKKIERTPRCLRGTRITLPSLLFKAATDPSINRR